MQALRQAEEIRDVNTRYHDAAAETYDTKWGIDFGAVGQAQVVRKLGKVLGPELAAGYGRSLEIGAGTGYFSLNLLRSGVVREATCTDISPGMVRMLTANADRLGLEIRAARADAESLPFPNQTFDLVLGHAVLHHLPDLDRAFAEFHRVLRPGGRIAFAGEPSRFGDRLASIPKRAATAFAPAWRSLLQTRPAPPQDRAADPSRDGAAGHDGDRAADRNGERPVDLNGARAPDHDLDHALERFVDIHAFAPGDLRRLAAAAGFRDVRIHGEELVANWFGWFNRALEASAHYDDVPMFWRLYAFHGYLWLQRLDQRVLEPLLPAAIFYNLLMSARKL